MKKHKTRKYFFVLKQKIKNNFLFFKSISINVISRPLSMVISVLYTPLLLRYLGDEKYGIWVTLSSIINWILVFDIGIGNGLRNVLTVKYKQQKHDDIQGAVSSAYFMLGGVVMFLFLTALCVSLFINWNNIFKSSIDVLPVITICLIFISINFVASLQKSVYFAIQQSEVNSVFNIGVQLINLLGIIILQNYSTNKLAAMAFLTGLSSFSMNILFSYQLWKKYYFFIPSYKNIKKTFIKEVCNIGIKFFLLQIAALILFTTDNIIIAVLYGAEAVTAYSIPFALFGVINSIFMAFLIPFWSKFTEVKEQNNWLWIKNVLKWLNILMIPFVIVIIFVVLFFDSITLLWLGRKVNHAPYLLVSLGVYCFLQMYNAIYSSFLNGIGDINLQLVIALVGSIINIPLSVFLAKHFGFGPAGVCMATIFGFVIGAIVFTVQVNGILRRNQRSLCEGI